MSKLTLEKATDEKLKELDVSSWSAWGSEVTTFDCEYDCQETAYVLEGKVRVKTSTEEVEINKGDIVTFPAGLKCVWSVLETIKKVYRFN